MSESPEQRARYRAAERKGIQQTNREQAKAKNMTPAQYKKYRKGLATAGAAKTRKKNARKAKR